MIVRAPERLDIEGDDGVFLQLTGIGEVKKLYKAIDENREFLQTFQPWARDQTLVMLRESIPKRIEQNAKGEWYQYWIMRPDGKGDTEVIGMETLFDHNPDTHEVFLGYWLTQNAQGHNYAYRASKSLLDFGFSELGLYKVKLNIRPENVRSEALAQRLGAVPTEEWSAEVVDGVSYPMRTWEIVHE